MNDKDQKRNRKRKSKRKRIATLVLANALAVFGLFILLEITIRFLGPEISLGGTDRMLFGDGVYGESSGLQKNATGLSNGISFTVDNRGFWRYSARPHHTNHSWLFLGDSVTMGMGVHPDSTFAGRLASQLDTVNVLNPSRIGYDIDDYERIFDALVARNRRESSNGPEITRVFLFWCLNDIYSEAVATEDPGSSLRSTGSIVLDFAREHLKSYHFLKTIVFDRPKSYFKYVEPFYEPGSELLEHSVGKIRRLSRVADSLGVQFDVVMLPYEYQLRRGAEASVDVPQQALATNLEKAGVRVYDPAAFLSHAGSDESALYLYGDGIHFSTAGHAAVARYLLEKVVR